MIFKKHRFLISLLVLTLIFGLCSPSFAAPEREIATEVYYNGTIVTVDKNMSNVQAVAVKDGKIIAVGNLGKIMQYAGKGTKHINLQGKTMLPGFYDAHSHMASAGLGYLKKVQLQSPPVGTIKNFDELIAALADRAKETPAGEWIQGVGYDDYELEEQRHPTCLDLDKASTDHPIIITHFSGHASIVNSKALELSGVTKDTQDPPGGVIGRFPDGTPNGQFYGNARTWGNEDKNGKSLLPPDTYQDRLDGLALASEIWASVGTTTANDGGRANTLDTFKLFKDAADKGYLKVRANLWFGLQGAKDAHDYIGSNRSLPQYAGKNDLVVVGGVKYQVDGSPQLRTAFMTDPYYTTGEYPADWKGLAYMTPEECTKAVIDAHEAGFNQILIHGNGDAGIDMILDAYEEIRKPGYRQSDDLRHIVIHSQFQREDQIDRMAEMDIIPSFYPLHIYNLADRHMKIQGPGRALRMSASKDAVNRDMIFTFHSDTAVLPHNPLLMMHSAVNRLSYTGQKVYTETYDPDDKYRSIDQRISPEDALRAVTINAAYQNYEENVTGSIEVGKRADFVILAENPLKVDPMHIKDIQVLETIVGGETVFKAEGKWNPGKKVLE
ncbi:MAG: amidohydrolase [Peptococcales bacterium]|jgi:predicted amidohydrolase YtcJ